MILVTGANGQLGYDVVKELSKRGIAHRGVGRNELDITDENAVRRYIKDLSPIAVIHCAAYTAVDKAEDEVELCTLVNVKGTEYIATACKEVGAKMMYISTDYVFSGEGDMPYEVDDNTDPKGIYGTTKHEGEQKVVALLEDFFIVRISWVFGVNGNNFVKTMLRLGKERDVLNVVNDQIGSPTYTSDVAILLCDMIETNRYGIYHVTNEGYCSWADFAKVIMQNAGLNCQINPIPSSEYPTKAVRPLNSRLSKKCLTENGFDKLPDWEGAVQRFLNAVEL